jgi:ParB/RepB/Spo0J family partition protein
MQIPVDKVLQNPDQPRTIFDKDEIKELAGTIKDKGQIHPIIVEKGSDGYFILIDGERRLMACKLLNLKTIRAEVREQASDERLELALISNLQRSPMGPVDEARAYQKLVEKYKSAAEVSRKIGVNAMTIGFRLSLLELPEEVQKLYNLKAFPMSMDVLRALKKLNPEVMISVAAMAATRGWTAFNIQAAVARQLKNEERIAKRKAKELKKTNPAAAEPVKVIEEKKPESAPKTFNTYKVDHTGHFNALAMVADRQYLPGKVNTATLGTCMSCPLYRQAGPKTCGQCPMVDFLNRLVVELKKAG